MTPRKNDLDVLRGILLILITVNHIGGPVSRFTSHPIGFVSAAEGFIFLSGYVLGLTFGQRLLNGDEIRLATISKKSLKIYGYHVVTLVFLLLPYLFCHPFLTKWQSPELIPIIENPVFSSTAFLLLLFQPEHLDVLPMYIVFFPVGLIALKALSCGKKLYVLGISSLLWLLGQFGIFSVSSTEQVRFGLFNLLSWQILFILGCLAGCSRSMGTVLIPKTKALLTCSLLLLLSFAMIRYGTSISGLVADAVRTFSAKENLQFFRLLNFLVIAYLIGYMIDSGYFPKSRPLAFIGRYSLQVFSFQIVLVFYYTPFRGAIFEMGPLVRLLVQLIAASLLFLPALIYQSLKIKQKDAGSFRLEKQNA